MGGRGVMSVPCFVQLISNDKMAYWNLIEPGKTF